MCLNLCVHVCTCGKRGIRSACVAVTNSQLAPETVILQEKISVAYSDDLSHGGH